MFRTYIFSKRIFVRILTYRSLAYL